MIDTISTLAGLAFVGAIIVFLTETIAPELCERVYAAVGAFWQGLLALVTALHGDVLEWAQRAVAWADEHYPDSERRWPQ